MKKRMTVLVCLCLAALLAACGSKAPAEATEPVATAPVETTAPVAEEATIPPAAEDHIIPTPYGDLHFPGDWAPFLKTETSENPYTVTFFAVLDTRDEPQRLFALAFGGDARQADAAVKTGSGYAAVAVIYEDFAPDDSWTDSDVNIVFTMQDALNYVMENLPLEDAGVLAVPETTQPAAPEKKPASEKKEPAVSQDTVSDDGALPESVKEDMAVDTPYMELHYPSKWTDNLSLKISEGGVYTVGYYASIGTHEKQHLFTVYFGGQQGSLLKTIKAESGEMVEIRLDVPELSLNDSWTEEEKSAVYAMQEDLNYLLSKMN